MKNDRQLVSAEEQAAQQADPVNSLKHVSEDTKRVMAKLNSADSATVSRLSLIMHEMSAFKKHTNVSAQRDHIVLCCPAARLMCCQFNA